MQLFTVINSLSEADILAIYSVSMLPEDNTKLENIVDLVFNKKASFYFILEAKKVSFWSELSPVLFSYRLRNILDEMEQPTLKFLRDIR
ncbi:hypothetical protein EV08_0398 [Prochlorococcus marinus str. SS2]|nr:hypothetical protein EV08_0398 [Prochlorococcus marinus str. SS2]